MATQKPKTKPVIYVGWQTYLFPRNSLSMTVILRYWLLNSVHKTKGFFCGFFFSFLSFQILSLFSKILVIWHLWHQLWCHFCWSVTNIREPKLNMFWNPLTKPVKLNYWLCKSVSTFLKKVLKCDDVIIHLWRHNWRHRDHWGIKQTSKSVYNVFLINIFFSFSWRDMMF